MSEERRSKKISRSSESDSDHAEEKGPKKKSESQKASPVESLLLLYEKIELPLELKKSIETARQYATYDDNGIMVKFKQKTLDRVGVFLFFF